MTNEEKERKRARKKVFDESILPKMFELRQECRRLGFPMISIVCFDDGEPSASGLDNVRPGYEAVMVSPASCKIKASPDYIAECIKVLHGYKTTKAPMPEFDMSLIDIPDDEDEFEDEGDEDDYYEASEEDND